MTREIPAPLRAAAGLAAAAVEEARRLPNRLAGLPVAAVGAALQASMRVQQRYAELVGRGDQVLSGMREPDEQPPWARFDEDEANPNGRTSAYRPDDGGWAFADEEISTLADNADAYEEYMPEAAAPPDGGDGLVVPADIGSVPAEDGVTGEAAADGSPDGPPVADNGSAAGGPGGPVVDLREAAAGASAAVAGSVGRAGRTRSAAARSGAAGKAAGRTKAAGAAGGGAAVKAGRTGGTAAGTAGAAGKGAGKAVKAAGRKSAAGKARAASGGAVPLENYERLTLPQVRARLPRLSGDELTSLLEHERAHAARPPYLTMLENRLNRVRKH